MTPLKAAGHDVVWAGDWPTDPGDEEILAQAYREGRVLITLDKDFGELAVVHELPHAGIIRLVVVSATQQATTCLMVLDRYRAELASGAVVTVEPGRIRVRPASSRSESS
jgi:predicted nuclease of predicted toxin-antitoxin system